MEVFLLLDLQLYRRATLVTVWQLHHKLNLDPILYRSNMSESGKEKRKREEDEEMPEEDKSESPVKTEQEQKRSKSGSEHILNYTKLKPCNNIIGFSFCNRVFFL